MLIFSPLSTLSSSAFVCVNVYLCAVQICHCILVCAGSAAFSLSDSQTLPLREPVIETDVCSPCAITLPMLTHFNPHPPFFLPSPFLIPLCIFLSSLSLRASRECQNKEKLLEQRFRSSLHDFRQWMVNANISTAKCFDSPHSIQDASVALQQIQVSGMVVDSTLCPGRLILNGQNSGFLEQSHSQATAGCLSPCHVRVARI